MKADKREMVQTAGKSLEAQDKISESCLNREWREGRQREQHEHSLYPFTLQKSCTNKKPKFYCTPELLYFPAP